MDRTRRVFTVIIGVALLIVTAVWIRGCIDGDGDGEPPATISGDDLNEESQEITILMWTNDTKADWIERVTGLFNESRRTTSDGRTIRVEIEQMDSGDMSPRLQAGGVAPTILSPGETSWVNDINLVWQDLHGRQLTSGSCTPVVYTAIGFSIWRPMAEAMGWPEDPISWQEIADLAADPEGWARYGLPQWGQFKFGHTHPDESNTGLLAIASYMYAALETTEGLTPEMVKSDDAREALRTLELNTYHYGQSSRSLNTKMAILGPGYLSAATNSEIGVLATNHFQEEFLHPPYTLVFIMPEGTVMWSDNPFCIVDADWVSEEQHEAAGIYLEYLLDREAQEIAVEEWLRPADQSIPVIGEDWEQGTDPQIKLGAGAVESVSGETKQAILDVFHEVKKRASLFIILDNSESMAGKKHVQAINATISFLRAYSRDREDEISIFLFNDQMVELAPSGQIGQVGERLISTVSSIFPEGNTILYDTVCEAMEAMEEREETAGKEGDPRLYAIIILSDGRDTNSQRSESDMWDCVPVRETAEGIKIYTIAYGDEADTQILERLANRSDGKFYESNPDHIEEVLLEILWEQ